MRITNKWELPEELVKVITPHSQSSPDRVSLTKVVSWSPLMYYLDLVYGDEISEDASDRLFALLGTAVHYILQHGASPDSLAEERFEVPIMGFRLTMRPDLWRDGVLTDWKVTSVYAYLLGEKIEWHRQLHGYAWGFHHQGFDTHTLQIYAIFRDWSRTKAMYERDYPPIACTRIAVPMVPYEQTQQFIEEKLGQFRRVLDGHVPDVCPDEYRWHRPDTYAVKKKGTKRAVPGGAKFQTREEAEEFVERRLGANSTVKYEIEYRPGGYNRCQNYCFARTVCPHNPYRFTEGGMTYEKHEEVL